MQLLKLPLSSIVIGDRFRKKYEKVEELADSIEALGQIHPPLISTDLQTDAYHLVAGGRRMAAFALLGWTEAYFCIANSLSEDDRRELELEENMQREDMTWQEKVLGIAETHKLKAKRFALQGQSWGYRQTGQLLGLSLGKVAYCLNVAAELRRDPEGELSKADSLADAIRVLDRRQEDAYLAELAKRGGNVQTLPTSAVVAEAGKELVTTDSGEVISRAPVVDLGMLLNAKIENYLPGAPEEWFDHIITDPPYGIDMEMLDQQNPHGGMENIDAVKEEHDVAYNEELFRFMVPHFYRILKPQGFLCMWCDVMQWQNLYDLCIEAGFKVQRWPLVWHKTHACMNQAAQYNFTKNHEFVIVCRKGGATLVQSSPTSIVVAANDADKKKFGHPFVKPYGVWEFLLRHVSSPGQLIYEPFAGVGSGVIAPLKMNRRVFATERNTAHYNRLVENVKQYYLSLNKNTIFV